jgi:hypothetical protein
MVLGPLNLRSWEWVSWFFFSCQIPVGLSCRTKLNPSQCLDTQKKVAWVLRSAKTNKQTNKQNSQYSFLKGTNLPPKTCNSFIGLEPSWLLPSHPGGGGGGLSFAPHPPTLLTKPLFCKLTSSESNRVGARDTAVEECSRRSLSQPLQFLMDQQTEESGMV